MPPGIQKVPKRRTYNKDEVKLRDEMPRTAWESWIGGGCAELTQHQLARAKNAVHFCPGAFLPRVIFGQGA
jgi:hypothetical protein